jgi:hypothetical protein
LYAPDISEQNAYHIHILLTLDNPQSLFYGAYIFARKTYLKVETGPRHDVCTSIRWYMHIGDSRLVRPFPELRDYAYTVKGTESVCSTEYGRTRRHRHTGISEVSQLELLRFVFMLIIHVYSRVVCTVSWYLFDRSVILNLF